MDTFWKSATDLIADYLTSLAASGTYDLLFFYLHKRGIINREGNRIAPLDNFNEAVDMIRKAENKQPSPPLPIAVRFALRKGEYFTLQPGFLCFPWIRPWSPMIDPQIPPNLEWPKEWRRFNTVDIFLIRKDIKQLKVKLSFDSMPTTQDGYAIRQCEINVFFSIPDFQLFINEFLQGMKFIFEEDDFIDDYLKQGFSRAFEDYVSRYTKNELMKKHRRAKLFELHLETAFQSDEGLNRILTESGTKLEGINYVNIEWDADGDSVLFENSCAKQSQMIHPTLLENLYGIEVTGNNVKDGIFWRSKLEGRIAGRPALDEKSRRIIIGTRKGHVYFLDYLGKVCKHIEAPGEDFEAGVVLWQEKAIVTSRTGKVWIISITNDNSDAPEELNSNNLFYDFKKTIRTSPAIYGDNAYFSIADGIGGIYKLDLNSLAPSEELIWRTTTPKTGHIKTAPLIAHDSFLLFAASKGWGRCSLDGTSSFFVSYPEIHHTNNSVNNPVPPRVAGRNVSYDPKTGTLFVGHTILGLLAIDIDKQRLKEKTGTNIPVWVSPTIYQKIAFVGNDQGQVLAIDTDGNNPNPSIWPLKVTDQPIQSQAVVWHDILFVADTVGTIFAIKIKDGVVWWSYRTGNAIYAPLLVNSTSGTVFASHENGYVTALKWHFNKMAEGIDMLKDWGKIEQAGHLAFLNGEYKKAKNLWETANSGIGRSVISQCRQYGMQGDVIEPLNYRHSDIDANDIIEIGYIHTPASKEGEPVDYKFNVILTKDFQFDALFLSILGDIQQPITEEELSQEEIKTLREKKSITIQRTITPTQLETSFITIRLQYKEFGMMKVIGESSKLPILVHPPRQKPMQIGDVQELHITIATTEEGIAIETNDVGVVKSHGSIGDVHIEGDAGAVINRDGDMGDIHVDGDVGLIKDDKGKSP